jgi:hypothetical protein
MTNEEYEAMVSRLQKELGLSKEDIAIGFFSSFYDGLIDRKQLDAVLAGIGFKVSDDYAKLSDDELKKKIFKKEEDEAKEDATPKEVEEAKTDPTGEVPPTARKSEEKKKESEDEPEEDEEKIKEEVMKMYFPERK